MLSACFVILSRFRNVEKENEIINQQFRQGFAQSINHMEDSLNRFVQDHSKFMTDLSSNYGTSLVNLVKRDPFEPAPVSF